MKRAIIEVIVDSIEPDDDTGQWRYHPETLKLILDSVFEKSKKKWDYNFKATKVSIIEEEYE